MGDHWSCWLTIDKCRDNTRVSWTSFTSLNAKWPNFIRIGWVLWKHFGVFFCSQCIYIYRLRCAARLQHLKLKSYPANYKSHNTTSWIYIKYLSTPAHLNKAKHRRKYDDFWSQSLSLSNLNLMTIHYSNLLNNNVNMQISRWIETER